jgi:hypothetical protein
MTLTSSQDTPHDFGDSPPPMCRTDDFIVKEDEGKIIFSKDILTRVLETAAKDVPKAVSKLTQMKPFDFGPRPKELKGITSESAVENHGVHDKSGRYLYFGEVANYNKK